MKRNVFVILLSILILGLTVACMSNSLTSNLSDAIDSASDSDSQESDTSSSNVLLEEDFSNSNTGWDIFNTEAKYGGAYEDGMYVLTDVETQSYAWGFANKFFSDTSIEVESHLISGPIDSESGIICRQDGDNFYYGLVSVDGYYGIFKSTPDDFALVQMESMPYNESIKKENAVNKIRFDCVGSTLSLYVNDVLLAQVTDSDFTSGDIGLLVGTYDEGNAKYGFDNLVVSAP